MPDEKTNLTPGPVSGSAGPTSPAWIRPLLLAAGGYNVLWGAWAVFFPSALFSWLEMPQPNYPQLWQCIGMIVGVYGLGYAIAAFDPVRHWPIVLVGLLGKVFGPIGMAQAVWTGALPWTFALTCVTNDLIWWIPFFFILKHAWDVHQAGPADSGDFPGEGELLAGAMTTKGRSVAEISHERPVLLVFLRHSGCTFCREAMADLAARRAEIEARRTQIVLIHMGAAEAFAAFAVRYGLGDLPAISDPDRALYRGLGLRRATLGQLLGWRVWVRGAKSFFSGHFAGKFDGDTTQMPGAFLVSRGRVVRRFAHETAAERPDYVALCEVPRADAAPE